MIRTVITTVLLGASVIFGMAQAPLAAKPPMGWNSWNHFGAKISDADVRATVDRLVSTGMRDAGYVYVNIDDGWQGKRDGQGNIQANDRFPDMKALGQYIHSKGLKFGIYSSPGFETCAHFEGSLRHEAQDAKTYASCGVDYLKYDLCSFDKEMEKERKSHPNAPDAAQKLMIDAYRKMGEALRQTGRPMLYSLCQYGWADVWKWAPEVGAQMWRTTDDISDNYSRMFIIGSGQAPLAKYAGPGHWNDPDMLEIGNGQMSPDEYRAHMSLWALLAAPLLAGNNLTKMTAEDKAILMNREVIALDQDDLGKQGERILLDGDVQIWKRQLSGGRAAIGIFSSAGTPREVLVNLSGLGLSANTRLHDVWKGGETNAIHGTLPVMLQKHSVALFVTQP